VLSYTDKLLRPTWVEISRSALRRNYECVRQLAGARKVMAVVKADAYGHGAVCVSKFLDECGADWFGVATVEEALELRAAGIRKPILLLGGLYMSDPAALIEHDLTPTVSSTARLDTYAECARHYGKPIRFHLKIDTGMGRLGMPPNLLDSFIEPCARSMKDRASRKNPWSFPAFSLTSPRLKIWWRRRLMSNWLVSERRSNA